MPYAKKRGGGAVLVDELRGVGTDDVCTLCAVVESELLLDSG